jgi:DNA-binding transcriptional regulator YiaG
MSPTPTKIKSSREAAGLTQAQAAALVHSTQRSWQKWESGERRMLAAVWELFEIKTTRSRRAPRQAAGTA